LSLLLGNKISLFAYHLPLDAHPQIGNNWRAASEMGWKQLESFGTSNGLPIGVKGLFPPVSIQDFTKLLVDFYGHKATLALGGKSEVQSAALISGSAHRYIEQAALERIDCFVTGSFDEPVWDIAHERGINFISMGHHATERVGVMALQEHITNHLGIPCEFIDLPNPF
jgi:putative NIF3 family GTP cyclohydrolase 1 type 2